MSLLVAVNSRDLKWKGNGRSWFSISFCHFNIGGFSLSPSLSYALSWEIWVTPVNSVSSLPGLKRNWVLITKFLQHCPLHSQSDQRYKNQLILFLDKLKYKTFEYSYYLFTFNQNKNIYHKIIVKKIKTNSSCILNFGHKFFFFFFNFWVDINKRKIVFLIWI